MTHKGEHYETHEAKLYTLPDGPIPLYISSLVPASAGFAGEYGDLGFDHLIFHSAGPDQQAFIEGYGRDVLPKLRERSKRSSKAPARKRAGAKSKGR